MSNFDLNLIDSLRKDDPKDRQKPIQTTPSSSKKYKKTIIRIIAIFTIVSILVLSRGALTKESLIQEMPKLSFWQNVARVIFFQEHLLKGEISDRVNILLLGMGGAEHEGPYLTDTIILASFKPSTKELALLSFPRDLWVPIPDYGWGKINAANTIGQAKEKDGAKLASMVINEITNTSIHYFVRIDFNGFEEIINALGGIEVEVERSFTDSMYPGPNFTYRTIRFQKGWQKMDGARALEYVRSRHGTGGEGSDFARMQRQQKVITAIKDKVMAMNIIENPQKTWTLFNLLNKYFETNLAFDEIIKLTKTLQNIQEDKIINKSFDLSEDSPLRSEIYQGAYILRTKSGDFSEISKITKNIFNKEVVPSLKLSEPQQKPGIIVLNGTFIDGLARAKAEILSSNFRIVEIGNAETRDYQKTIVYDLTNGQKNKEMNKIKEKLGEIETSQDVPLELFQKQIDFIIILGES